MALPPSAFAASMGHVSSRISNMKRGTTDVSEESRRSRLDVPTELMPYLTRTSTQDIIDYLNKESDQSEETRGYTKKFARSILGMHHFDSFMSLVIVLNLIVVILDIDRSADLEDTPAAGVHWTDVVGLGVLVIFLLELLLRLAVLRCLFFKDAWNVFDCVVVSLDMVFSVVGHVAASSFPASVLRICRLAKLARVLKVLRVFPELRLLLAGLISSASAIFWGAILLFFSMLLWGLVAVLIIHPLNAKIEYGDCERCPRAYSSVMHAVLTLWQSLVAGDSWGTFSIPVMEKHPYTVVFFVGAYLCVGMAVTNLILGVVVNVAHQASASLCEEDRFEQALAQLGRQTRLLQICRDMDSDGNGELSQEELIAAFEKPGEFRDTLDALGVSRDDFQIVWSILDGNRDGAISYKELVSRLSSIRTSDSEYMLNYIRYNMKELKACLMQKMDQQHASILDLERRLEKEAKTNILQASGGVVHGGVRSDSQYIAEDSLEAKEQLVNTSVPAGQAECHTSQIVASSSKDQVKTVFEFTSLHNDIEMLRMELKGILMDIESKFDQNSNLSVKESSVISMTTQSNLLGLPPKHTFPILSPQCRGELAGDSAVPARDRGAIDLPSGSALGLEKDGTAMSMLGPPRKSPSPNHSLQKPVLLGRYRWPPQGCPPSQPSVLSWPNEF